LAETSGEKQDHSTDRDQDSKAGQRNGSPAGRKEHAFLEQGCEALESNHRVDEHGGTECDQRKTDDFGKHSIGLDEFAHNDTQADDRQCGAHPSEKGSFVGKVISCQAPGVGLRRSVPTVHSIPPALRLGFPVRRVRRCRTASRQRCAPALPGLTSFRRGACLSGGDAARPKGTTRRRADEASHFASCDRQRVVLRAESTILGLVDATILLVEDDASIREITKLGLQNAGFKVDTAADGEEAIARFRRDRPDLVVLDVMLPKRDGLEVCRTIRAESSVPVVMLTARGDAIDIVVGLESGADDYVTKPFEMPVLVARIRAALRRAQLLDPTETLSLGPLRVDVLGHRVAVDHEEVGLTPTEFRLLLELVRRPGQVFTREMLLDRVWGYSYLGDSRLVDVAIQRLRAKLATGATSTELIETVRGVGYRAGR
jgi:two-component system response regulator MtrA